MGGCGHGAARGHHVVHQPHTQAIGRWRGAKAVLHIAAPSFCAQSRLLLAGNGAREQLGNQGHVQVFVQGFCQFVRLVVAPVPQVVGVLRHGGYRIGPGQTAHGFKHKAPEQRGEVQVAVKLEAQQGVAQGVAIKTVEGHGAPRRGILQACPAHHIALVGVGGRQPTAGAARPGVGRKLRGAGGAKQGVCENGCGNFCNAICERGYMALRSPFCLW